MTGVLNTDGATPTMPQVHPTTHILQVDDDVTGSDFGKDLAARDSNSVPVMMATDGSNNLINLYVNSSGKLLIKST